MKRKRTLIISAIALVLVAGGIITFLLVTRSGDGGLLGLGSSAVTVWHQYGEGTPERMYLDGLAERHSNGDGVIQVTMHYYEEQELLDRLDATKGTDEAPHLVFIKQQSLPMLAAEGVLAPLEEREDYAQVADSLLAAAVDSGKYEGHTYGLPFSVSAQIVVYNPQLFVVSSQEPLETMDGLRESIEKISRLDRDILGLGLAGTDAANLAPLIWSNGGELLGTGDEKASGSLNSAENVKLVQMLAALNSEGSVFLETADGESMLDAFADGRIGMVVAGPTFLKSLAETYPSFSYATMPVPEGAGGSHSVLDSMLMVVPQSEKFDTGWDYLKILAADDTQSGLASRGVIPAGKAAIDSAAGTVIAPFLPVLSSARTLPAVTRWNEMNAVLTTDIQKTLSGGEDPGAALSAIAKQWDTML